MIRKQSKIYNNQSVLDQSGSYLLYLLWKVTPSLYSSSGIVPIFALHHSILGHINSTVSLAVYTKPNLDLPRPMVLLSLVLLLVDMKS